MLKDSFQAHSSLKMLEQINLDSLDPKVTCRFGSTHLGDFLWAAWLELISYRIVS